MMPTVLSIDRTGPHAAIVRLVLPAGDPAFAGHFPAFPVLPGVVQVDWALRLAAECFGLPFRPANRLRVKFSRVIAPSLDAVSVSLRYNPEREEIVFEYRIGDQVASGGTAGLSA